MKHPIPVILFFISVFFSFQLLAISMSDLYFKFNNTSASANFNLITIIFSVIIIVVLFFAFVKIKKQSVVKIWMIFSYFVVASLPFYVLFNSLTVGLIISAVILFLRFKFKKLWLHDLGEFITYLGAIYILAPLFDPISSTILLVAFSIYDLVAVFITKHMIKMVKESSKLGILPAILYRYHGEGSLLGGGDLIFPATFSSVFWVYGLHTTAIFSAIGSTIGILFLFLIGKKKKPYPALPSITIFSFIFSIISLI